MGYKCTPQIKGLIRGTPKEGQKHRANGKKIAEEAGNERYSRSDTLDRTRSSLNEYQGFKAGGKCWDEMEAEAAEYRVKGKTKNGKEFERGLRADAVIGFAVIFNPPSEMTEGWTQDDYRRFYRDSWDAMNQIEPRLFRGENIKMTAIHRDEGMMDKTGHFSEHMHVIGTTKDDNGKYCGNEIDAALCVRINSEYPKLMRERGWDLDDLDLTDYSRMRTDENGRAVDPEYRAERIAKRKSAGRSVNKYRADKAAEADSLYLGAIQAYDTAMAKTVEIEQKEADFEIREKRNRLHEADLKKREAEVSRREKEAAEQAKKNTETAASIRNVGAEILKIYREAKEQYLQDQEWANEEYKKHIRERNAAIKSQQEKVKKSVNSVAPKSAGQNPQKNRRLPDMDNIRQPRHDDYSL